MNLLNAITLGVAAGLTVLLVRRLTGRTLVGVAAGLLLALTPIPWRVGSFADPHMLHLAFVAGLLLLLVGWEERARTGSAGADRWLVGAAALYGVALGNQALTVLLAPGIALFILAVEPGHVAASRPRGALCPGHPRDRRAPLPGAADPGGDGGSARVRPPGHVGWLLVRGPGTAVRRRARRAPDRPGGQGRCPGRPGDVAVRAAGGTDPREPPGHRGPPPAIRPPDNHVAGDDGLVRGLLYERGHRALLPGADPHRRELARDRRGRTGRGAGGVAGRPAERRAAGRRGAAPSRRGGRLRHPRRAGGSCGPDDAAGGGPVDRHERHRLEPMGAAGRRPERRPRDLVGLLHAAVVSPADPGRASRRQRDRRPDPPRREPRQRGRRDPREPGPAAGLPRAARRGRAGARGSLAARPGGRSGRNAVAPPRGGAAGGQASHGLR